MMFCMQAFQPFPCHMSINLRRGNITVSKQHLHDAQVRAVIEQMGGKGVA